MTGSQNAFRIIKEWFTAFWVVFLFSVFYCILIPLKIGNTPMTITRGLQSRARSHNWRVGSFFGVQADCHPHILHPPALEEVMLPWESAEIALWEGFHSTPPPPTFPAQVASCSPSVNRILYSHPSLCPKGEVPETWGNIHYIEP